MKQIILITTSLVLLLAACSGCQPVVYRAVIKQQPIQPVNGGFVAGVNSFGLKSAGLLYDTDKNLAFSPVSLELALSMTRTGAAGVTADEMKQALGLDGKFPFRQDFIDTCTEDFMADAFPLVIPGAKDDINSWADEKTHGRIDKLIPQELKPDDVMVLVNVLYFLGDWEVPFPAGSTRDGGFASPSGSVTVPFMHREFEVPYYENNNFSMISLAFKSGKDEGRYAMAFLLPKEGSSAQQVLSALDGSGFADALAGLEDHSVNIALPKFEYSFSAGLKESLTALGMGRAFDPDEADFSGMSDVRPLWIDDALHKCYIRIDELGAESSAGTAVMMAAGIAMDAKSFTADRPFLFAIYSQEDGIIAFMGAVNDPTQE